MLQVKFPQQTSVKSSFKIAIFNVSRMSPPLRCFKTLMFKYLWNVASTQQIKLRNP